MEFLLLLLAGAAYMLPTFIAAARRHQHCGPILLTNLLLGWTGLGWIGALVWSATTVNYPISDIQIS
jgi:hypothetical protein